MFEMSIRVGMVSLGCTKNQVDAERMLYDIREAGYQLVSDAALADIAVAISLSATPRWRISRS